METFERIVSEHFRVLAGKYVDPLQFAYQAKISVEDAIHFMLQKCTHT